MDRRMMLAGCAALGLTVAVAQAQAADVTLRLASVANDASSWGRAQELLKEEIAKRTDGRVELQIFNNNALGGNREALELAKNGGVDLVMTGLGHATRYAPQLNAVLFPYMWKDRETMFELLDGDVGQRLSDALAPQNLGVLAWWDNGFRHVSNNAKPIMAPEDIKGLKLRTLPSSVHVAFFRALGAVPTPMGFAELMPALQQGVIDGQENPPTVVYPYRLFEAQKYYSLTSHVNEPMVLVMSEATRSRLAPEDLAAIEAAAAVATAEQRRINAEETGKMLDLLRAEMEVNEVPEETIAAFREVARGVYDSELENLGDGGKEIVDMIVDANR